MAVISHRSPRLKWNAASVAPSPRATITSTPHSESTTPHACGFEMRSREITHDNRMIKTGEIELNSTPFVAAVYCSPT